jgi:mRNA interferase MazF
MPAKVKWVYIKEFDKWIERKKEYNLKIITSSFFKERDIWWTSIGVNVGYEEDGKHKKFIRPVLVLKKFNKELFLGIPMSTKLKNNKYYIKVDVQQKTVSVLISQIRVFSSRRIEGKLAELDQKDFARIKDEVIKMLVFSPSP